MLSVRNGSSDGEMNGLEQISGAGDCDEVLEQRQAPLAVAARARSSVMLGPGPSVT
jgi:hypothetical protein